MSKLFPSAPPADAPRDIVALMEQGKWWKTAGGEWLRIKKMTPTHKASAARMLLGNAPHLLARYDWCLDRLLWGAPDGVWEEWERESEERMKDPQAWIRSTKLYRKLTKQSKPDMRVDDAS